ncbi:adenine phosphoribosyltransferase [Ruminococcus sp. YE71]|uniref:phosphoribosyltransferase family protein n=1 Tax=unclassified Ruminococcus TaxID=2608920 RepID=UPI00088BBCCC|nr:MULTISPECIES: phosphoribosyltransferase family protein [unclassified Ruminococcus]SDA17462.1 adenine phosphoribosyltransferase [Ruminococcus sp. YE78]SFW26882.1 adenine phosphoribosyltransferase [Ruminococcus sp. YE71]
METYQLNIAGLERDLRLCEVNEHLDIAGFIMFSDVELTVKCAEALAERCGNYDVILTAESKGIPIAYELSRQTGRKYIVARKSVKVYMPDVISVKVKSITTAKEQTLYLSSDDAELMRDKNVLLLDDVISTGESLAALEKLAEQAGGIVSGKAAVLAEGSAAERRDIIYLETLPVFPK